MRILAAAYRRLRKMCISEKALCQVLALANYRADSIIAARTGKKTTTPGPSTNPVATPTTTTTTTPGGSGKLIDRTDNQGDGKLKDRVAGDTTRQGGGKLKDRIPQ